MSQKRWATQSERLPTLVPVYMNEIRRAKVESKKWAFGEVMIDAVITSVSAYLH